MYECTKTTVPVPEWIPKSARMQGPSSSLINSYDNSYDSLEGLLLRSRVCSVTVCALPFEHQHLSTFILTETVVALFTNSLLHGFPLKSNFAQDQGPLALPSSKATRAGQSPKMPSLEAHEDGVPAVASFQTLLWDLLARAELVKPATKLTPALNKADFEDLLGRLGSIFQAVESKGPGGSDDLKKNRQFAIVETAVRDVFGRLIVSLAQPRPRHCLSANQLQSTTSIESPAFVKVWNLFDILLILGENGECDSNLLLWLTEELFESQTIKGCEEVLHYLESRRQRIIAGNFSSKKLVILRACNELLRRLSRAKDPTVCGRVFIFMFQCFPLGDKSSVNLRGEFHTENETTFDNEIPEDAATPEKMDVDAPAEETKASDASRSKKESSQKAEPKALKPSELYRVFWSLQESFSQPKKLFDQTQFAAFKTGMEATMTAFKQIANEHQTASKQGEESKRKLKRKRDDETSGSDENYNPKYLTSRDLFELEVSTLRKIIIL